MANNQNVNKVVYDGTTLIDLTQDDVVRSNVLNGKYFHLPDGTRTTGTATTATATVSGTTLTLTNGFPVSFS